MMSATLLLVLCIATLPSVDSLVMFGLPNVTIAGIAPVPLSTFNGIQTPTYMWRQQDYNEKRGVWGRNYSFIPSPDVYGCVTMDPAKYTNAIVTGIAGGNNHCTFSAMVTFAGGGNAAAVLILGPIPQLIAMIPAGAMPAAFMPPAVTWENLNTDVAVSKQIPLNLIALAVTLGGVANLTLQLDYPVQNPLFYNYNNVPTAIGFVFWFGITLCLIAVTFSFGKLFAFYTHDYLFSIGGACLGFCWFGCIWLLLNAFMGGNAGFAPGGVMTLDCNAFWELWIWTCSASALMLIGFYFQEVALLTQQQSIPGLDRFKVPGVITIGVLWVANIILSSLSAGYKTNDVPPPTSGSYGIAVSVIYGIVGGAVLIIVVIGSIVLLRSMSGNLVRLILPVVLLALFSTGMFGWCLGLWIQLRYFFETIPFNQQTLTCLTMVTLIWGNAIIYICLSFMFSVQTNKEIEISKSATSSTSSTSKSSGGSSSSASRTVDPVVEL